jgi:hypothetical protein
MAKVPRRASLGKATASWVAMRFVLVSISAGIRSTAREGLPDAAAFAGTYLPPITDWVLNECLAPFTPTHNEGLPCRDCLLPVECGYPSRQPSGAPRIPRIRPIRVESELQLTIRELRSRGSGASLDVREGSMLAMTLLPGA